jgi:hypothetical protein
MRVLKQKKQDKKKLQKFLKPPPSVLPLIPPHKDEEVELKDLFTGQLSHNHV